MLCWLGVTWKRDVLGVTVLLQLALEQSATCAQPVPIGAARPAATLLAQRLVSRRAAPKCHVRLTCTSAGRAAPGPRRPASIGTACIGSLQASGRRLQHVIPGIQARSGKATAAVRGAPLRTATNGGSASAPSAGRPRGGRGRGGTGGGGGDGSRSRPAQADDSSMGRIALKTPDEAIKALSFCKSLAKEAEATLRKYAPANGARLRSACMSH